MPGFFVSPAWIFQSVVNGTPDRSARARRRRVLKVEIDSRTVAVSGIEVLMPRNLPHCVSPCQRDSVHSAEYGYAVDISDPNHPRRILWDNICSLMGDPVPTIHAVRDKTKIGQGTVQRLRDLDVSVGLDVLEKIAEAFNVQVWQLLAPKDQMNDLPPDAMVIAREFNKLPMNTFEQISARRWTYAAILRVLSLADTPDTTAPAPLPAPKPTSEPHRLK